MSELYLRNRWFEDIPVGEFHVFGSHTLSELEMVEFAQQFAPQPEFVDPDAARGLRWGGLVATPWHLCALWMSKMVDYMEVYAQGVNDGRRNGAGVAIRELEWLEPVRPGHTLTFTYEITGKPDRVVRDRWGIICSRNEAFNQYGNKVMAFEIDILAERAPSP
ncbi:MAG: MaoC family dehydratase N-terminal domain-containing protein [Cellvibrionales bacterium]|jgi:acyl dehydratase